MDIGKINFESPHEEKLNESKIIYNSLKYLNLFQKRRSTRDFSDKKIQKIVLENCLKVADLAPSGANKQPWRFVCINNKSIKKAIQIAAEKEEKLFYEKRASEKWLKDLKPFETNHKKTYLTKAPSLIAIFAEIYKNDERGNRLNNYYPMESTGIATGFLISSLHYCGLNSLTHTPSPMRFLNEILEVPTNFKPFLLLVVGHKSQNYQAPELEKTKNFEFI